MYERGRVRTLQIFEIVIEVSNYIVLGSRWAEGDLIKVVVSFFLLIYILCHLISHP